MTVTYKDHRMLVIAPHWDDAEFGIGGWMARAQEEGIGTFRVVVVAGGDYEKDGGYRVSGELREREGRLALAHLGVEDVRHLAAFSENAGDYFSQYQLVKLISQEIGAYQPDEVFIPLPSFNQDHEAIHKAAVTVFRPGKHPCVSTLWHYQYPGNDLLQQDSPTAGKAYLVLHSRHMEAKMRALAEHKSQFGSGSSAVNPDAAMSLARQRGAEVGVEFAELVFMAREIHR